MYHVLLRLSNSSYWDTGVTGSRGVGKSQGVGLYFTTITSGLELTTALWQYKCNMVRTDGTKRQTTLNRKMHILADIPGQAYSEFYSTDFRTVTHSKTLRSSYLVVALEDRFIY